MLEEGELGIFVEPTLEGVSPYISEDTVVLRFRSPGYGESEWGDYVVYGGDSTGSGRPDPPFLGVLPGAIPPELIEILAEEGWQPLTLP